jgi:hypothetical protein
MTSSNAYIHLDGEPDENPEETAKPKTVTVTGERGSVTYAADDWLRDEHALDVISGKHVVASFAPGSWRTIELDGRRADSDADRYKRAFHRLFAALGEVIGEAENPEAGYVDSLKAVVNVARTAQDENADIADDDL